MTPREQTLITSLLEDIAEENKRMLMIASAPELLAALKAMLEIETDESLKPVRMARAAIRKAELK